MKVKVNLQLAKGEFVLFPASRQELSWRLEATEVGPNIFSGQ